MAKKIVLPDFEKASTEQLESNLSNFLTEREQYLKHKAHHERLVELHMKRLALHEKLSGISDVKNAPLEPQYEFQKDAEWVRLQSELLQLESEAKRQEMRDEIDRLTGIITKTAEELARFDAAIPAVEAELARRKEVSA